MKLKSGSMISQGASSAANRKYPTQPRDKRQEMDDIGAGLLAIQAGAAVGKYLILKRYDFGSKAC